MKTTEIIKDLTFEDFKHENGITFWWASHLMKMLKYSKMKGFEKVIERAIKVMISLNIKHYENIIVAENPITKEHDFKLTRFAAYLIVMNADSKRIEVAQAQAYFALMTQKFEDLSVQSNEIDRLVIRDEIKEGNKSLSGVVKQAGIRDYAKFTNKGYLGMYNMQNWKLANKRNIDKKKLFDNMGRFELSANLFRITMTEEKIKNKNISGQASLENTHFDVGKQVRNIVLKNTGVNPENLPQEKSLPSVKKEVKKEFREIKKIDK